MIDFTAYPHPVMAVRCPECGKAAGVYCYRPSGHKASDFHRSLKDLADQIFIQQHGNAAAVFRSDNNTWLIDPNGLAPDMSEPSDQLQLF
ncbi:zinc finger domain-containing protein [Alterisphingorhabdus coralli]|uniref:DNA-binding phage zinc finger domain-containing protein n=1 Tax=Alterisphingorhabdus coralli TaxID=3071408 RepID=A0AA97FA66_9SPHN|nr:hypothetical protein [Parasphingorhabdus sp. SCSIO 66989]WOE76756.1 hypothetical protein RB602_15330 [Parasphingorhabdus sp. SCSIO 66989]